MGISGIAIKKPVTVLMVVIALFYVGYMALGALNIDLFPDIDIPITFIQAVYPGVDPAEMENTVTKIIEDEVSTVNNIKKMTSYSLEGFSQIVIEFNWGTNIDFGAIDLREKTDIAKRTLPRDIENLTVSKFDINSQALMAISIAGGKNPVELRRIVDNEIKPAIERVDGVAQAEVSGGLVREIHIDVDVHKLEEYKISIQDIVSAIAAGNNNMPAGDFVEGEFKYLLRTEGEVSSVGELGKITVKKLGDTIITVNDLAKVVDTYEDITSIGRIGGAPSVNVTLKKSSGSNPVNISKGVRSTLEKLKEKYPDFDFVIGQDSSEFIEDSIEMAKSNAISGAVLAVIVLFLFLKNIRSTLIIGIAIPVSLVTTFGLMYLKEGMTLNMMTLGGLALGIGMLLDNSIVVLENVYRYFTERPENSAGKNSALAADEVSMPVLSSTLTTLAVFAPIGFVPGTVGIIFFNMSLSIVFSLLSSYFVAFTVIPALTAKFLKIDKNKKRENEEGKIFGKIKSIYERFLSYIIAKKSRILLYFCGIMFIFFGALMIFPPQSFFPDMDRGQVFISLSLSEGSTVEEVDKVVSVIEKKVFEDQAKFDENNNIINDGVVDKVVTNISLAEASLLISLVNVEDREITTNDYMNILRDKVKNIPNIKQISFSTPKLGPPSGGKPIQIEVIGDSYDRLEEYCKLIAQKITHVNGIKDLDDGVDRGRPEVKIRLNRAKIRDLGLSFTEVSSQIRTNVYGSVASKYKESNDEFDVRVKLEDEQVDSVEKIKNMKMFIKGKTVIISNVAEVELSYGYTRIIRKDKKRTLTVESDFSGVPLGQVISDISKELEDLKLPEGYFYKFGGEEEERREAFGNLGIALIAAIFLVYMIMASQFESVIEPFVIMFTIPLSIIGVVMALRIFDLAFSVTAIIGIIMLAGIVVNNGILLIDYINHKRRDGHLSREQAIVEAGLTRIRPIFMTTSTTVLGMLPLALGLGAGSDFYQPLAVTVIGGLLVSTIMTLTFIPVTYIIVEGIKDRFCKLFGIINFSD